MRSPRIALGLIALVAAAACATDHAVAPPKPPNDELIVGEYERHPPDGATAARFRGDGSVRIAKSRAQLDAEPPLALGTWKLEGDRLTLTYDQGMCSEASERTGVYKVVISKKIGIRFTKVEDACARRSAIDGQTWWRIKK